MISVEVENFQARADFLTQELVGYCEKHPIWSTTNKVQVRHSVLEVSDGLSLCQVSHLYPEGLEYFPKDVFQKEKNISIESFGYGNCYVDELLRIAGYLDNEYQPKPDTPSVPKTPDKETSLSAWFRDNS